MTTVLVVLHVLTMFTAVAISQGPALMLWIAMRRGDVMAIRGVGVGYQKVGPAIGALFGIGVLFGVAAIFAGGFDPFAPWLIIAYVLTVIAFLTPRLLTVPIMMRVMAAAEESSSDAPSPALSEAIGRAVGPIFWVDAVILVLFIVDMIVKPFS